MPSLSIILRMEQELRKHLIEITELTEDKFDWSDDDKVKILGATLNIPPGAQAGDLSTNFLTPIAREYDNGRVTEEIILNNFKKKLMKEAKWEYLKNIWLFKGKQGYIHLNFTQEFWWEVIKEIGKRGKDYGKDKLFSGKVQMEFVSANPTGPLNVVNARAAAVGDALYRAFSALGYEVTKEYYVNDEGRQVELLGQSVWAAKKTLSGEETPPPQDGYRGDYIFELAEQIEEREAPELGWIAMGEIVQQQKQALEKYGVTFDNWYHQSSLYDQGYIDKAVKALEDGGYIYEKDKARWFRSSEFGDDADRVIKKSDGSVTYYLADLAYHVYKHEQSFETVIDILGPDHHAHSARMQAGMQALGYGGEWLEILIAQQVNIVRAGERVKMGKRVGEFITLDELVEEVGVDVAKYFFLERGLSSHLDFDFELAKKTSMENPVYYIQYAHARVCSIIREAKAQKLAPDYGAKIGYVFNDDEVALIKLLLIYPKELLLVVLGRQPQVLCAYLHSLAGMFHRYYTDYRVLQADTAEAVQGRLNLVDAIRQVIANGLEILGISAPESM